MYSWGHTRRFNAYPEYFKKRFGSRVQKLAIDAGFTCPNRDGTLGTHGCSFCDSDSFNPSYCSPEKSITQQLQEGIDFHKNRYRKAEGYLAYFQAYSNTYAPLNVLKDKYEEALSFPGVMGLVIGTRPDCIHDELLDYLSGLTKMYYVSIEYGIESCYDATLCRVDRGHNFSASVQAIRRTADYGILSGGHIIFGLPGESREMMVNQAAVLSGLPLHSLKIHQLQIIKNTPMAREFNMNPEEFHFFDLEEYLEHVIDFVEQLSPEIIIERIAGEVPPRFLAGKSWGLIRNTQILSLFEKRLQQRNTWQGRLYKKA